MARKNILQDGSYTEILAYLDKAVTKAFPDPAKRLEAISALVEMLKGSEGLELSKLVSLYKTFQKVENPTMFADLLIGIYTDDARFKKESTLECPMPTLSNPMEGYE